MRKLKEVIGFDPCDDFALAYQKPTRQILGNGPGWVRSVRSTNRLNSQALPLEDKHGLACATVSEENGKKRNPFYVLETRFAVLLPLVQASKDFPNGGEIAILLWRSFIFIQISDAGSVDVVLLIRLPTVKMCTVSASKL